MAHLMHERKSSFPERYLIYSTIFLILAILMTNSPNTESPAYPFYVTFGAVLTSFAGIALLVVFVLALGIWKQRRGIAGDALRISLEISKDLVRESSTDENNFEFGRPAYLLVNSIDREVLQAISQMEGDLNEAEWIIRKKAFMKKGMEYTQSLAKLMTLGLISEPSGFPYYTTALTSRGLDALNAPGALFVSNIPDGIWQYVFKLKSSLTQKDWSGAGLSMGNAMQMMLVHRLKKAQANNPEKWNELRENYSGKPLMDWSLGHLHGAIRSIHSVNQGTFEDFLIGELIKLRNRVHPPEEAIQPDPFLPKEAAIMDLYLDILLQLWYGS
ncbi:MAG: hypothetical protein ACFFER_13300 [Candidatus Thorarchaeota archaeon]